MKAPVRIFGLLLALGLQPTASYGYENETHRDLTDSAFTQSILADPNFTKSLGIASADQKFPNSASVPQTIRELLKTGADVEDGTSNDLLSLARVADHFYNPLTGQGLRGKIHGVVPVNGIASPVWALAAPGSLMSSYTLQEQQSSFYDARQYFFWGLTLPTKTQREMFLGLGFQSLGQVVHHLQDMAQPQHVRNDIHVKYGLGQASLYEIWTDDNRASLPSALPPGYSLDDPSFKSLFADPFVFWSTRDHVAIPGVGIADYTNRGFVSAGTNFNFIGNDQYLYGNFPRPRLNLLDTSAVDIASLCETAISPCPAGLTGKMTFVASQVDDLAVPAASGVNPRTSAYSFFTQDLLKKPGAPLVFSLNQFNFTSAHTFLIPHAVAYSAAMINYFFRGKVKFVPDPQNPGGWIIQNLGDDDLDGTFALYYDAADGTRKPVPNASWDLAIAAHSQSKTPIFVAPPFDIAPKNFEVDGLYLLVFRGKMGAEPVIPADGGAVAATIVPARLRGLYVLGVDATNRPVSFKADASGTHILLPGEWDPLSDWSFTAPHPVVDGKLQIARQAAFFSAAGRSEYQLMSLAVPRTGSPFQVLSYLMRPTGPIGVKPHVAWMAASPDPTVGRFEFQYPPPSLDLKSVSYQRFFTGADGGNQSDAGIIALPPLNNLPPTNFFKNSYAAILSGDLPISSDGTRLCGIQEDVTTMVPIASGPLTQMIFQSGGFRRLYCLQITLGVQPSASLVVDVTAPAGSQIETRNNTLNLAGNVASLVSEPYNFVGADVVYAGFLNGDFQRVIVNVNDVGDVVLGPTNWSQTYALSAGSISAVNSCWHEPLVSSYSPRTTSVFTSGRYPFRLMTTRADDAIYNEFAGSCDAVQTTTGFRGTAVPDNGYVADSSPLGEIFFATTDKSFLVHEPSPGMPQIKIPPAVVRLLAAVWL